MFKRVFNPYVAAFALVGGVVVSAQTRCDREDVIEPAAGPAPLCRGESRLSRFGRNAVADANRQGPVQED